MGDFEFVHTYIDDLLITTKSTWNDHLRHLDIVFHRIHEAFFGKDELEYLGYWITRQGIQPVSKKVEAIKNIATPKTQ